MLQNYLIIHESILPEYYAKILEARQLMESGKVKEVSQAVKQVGISRSTYYKYKDYIFEPSEFSDSRKAVISFMLNHEPGILSAVLARISEAGASVFAITQSPPIHSMASVTITLDISSMTGSVTELLETIENNVSGAENTRLIALE